MINKEKNVKLFSSIMYFCQGITALSGIAIPLLLRQIGFSLTEIATLGMISGIPWFCKILYGSIADSFPIFNSRRKSYIALGCILSALGWIFRFLFGASSGFLFWAITGIISSLGWCIVDVTGDGLVVENSTTSENSNTYQNLCWGARAFGAAVTAFLGGILCKTIGYVNTIGIVAIFPLFPLTVLRLVKEKKVIQEKTRNLLKQLWTPVIAYFSNKQLLWISAFIVLGMLSPSYGLSWFFRMKDLLKFDEPFLGFLGSIGSLSIIGGAFIYQKYLKNIPLTKLLKYAVFIWAFNTASVIFIINRPTAIIFEIINAVIGHIAFIPLLAIAAKRCQTTIYEAALFAMVCSLSNLTGSISSVLGAKLFEYTGFYPLVAISTVTTFFCYPIIKYIKEK